MRAKRLLGMTCLLYSVAVAVDAAPPKMPMLADANDAAATRWLGKKVLASKLLADMEDLSRWKLSTGSQGKGDIALTADRAKDGKHSLRFRSQTKGAKPSADGGVFGSTAAVRAFGGEDWSDYNRLSFWVWPDLPGHHAVALMVHLGNRGKPLGRDMHHVLLANGRWNQVVWEIPDLARESVTEVAFTYVMNGSEAGASEIATFDIDRLELQRVEADHYEGWNVAPGRIAFSHTGYPTGGPKAAVVSGLDAGQFELLREGQDRPVLSKSVAPVSARTGRLGVMDFSEVRAPGMYRLRAGSLQTPPFRIDGRVWHGTIWKAINFFYVERCGCAVPGSHGVCHADWQGVRDGKRIVINGGWHDAGDLSQGLVNTSEAVYAFFDLARRLRERGESKALVRRLIEEAAWGLDWVMKTSFRDGYRIQWAVHRFWTDNRPGTVDDVTVKARYEWPGSFYAAAAEAIAARVLKDDQPALAAKALAMAKEDWRFAVEALAKVRPEDINVEHGGMGALASLELFRATGEAAYAEKACELAKLLVASQQRLVPAGLKVPITGFFYRTTRKRQPMRYMHRGHEQAPIVALAGLCEALPDHPDWMDWYAAVALHSEYFQKAIAALTRPYHMLPNSLHHVDEAQRAGANDREAIGEQIAAGFDVGAGWHVRTYAVHPRGTFRGNYGTMLSQAKAVAAAAHLRRSGELAGLCQEQLYWVVGRNPFAQSTMYGEGHDFAPQYTARSGDIVGSLPVGVKSLGNRDLPYWPFTNVWNYKEVWVHPVSRWMWLMCELGGPAIARGRARPGAGVTFRDRISGAQATAQADAAGGRFAVELPAGAYDVRAGGVRQAVSLLPMQTRELDLRPGSALDLSAEHAAADGRVEITLTAVGTGRHVFGLRASNLDVPWPEKTAVLQPGRPTKVVWTCRVSRPGEPWVAVIVPDGRLDRRVEVTGLAPTGPAVSPQVPGAMLSRAAKRSG